MQLNPNLMFSDDYSLAGKSIEINHRDSKSRLAKLKQIKERANKNKDRTKEGTEIIDQSELNNIFASLEREILGVKGLFSYEYDKAEKKYYAVYMWVKLGIAIDKPEQLINMLNLLDKLIDDNIFKAGKKGKFETGKDWCSNTFNIKNTDRRFHNTNLINEATLETMTWNKEWSYQAWTHLWEALALFLNQVQERMNTLNHVEDVAQYQRKDLPKVQEEKPIPWIAQIDKIQKSIPKWGKIKKWNNKK